METRGCGVWTSPHLCAHPYHRTYVADKIQIYPLIHDNRAFILMYTTQIPLSCLHSD